ncbi:Gfo/Idh/MocA family protein [Candidatus Galacturonibacter soehngenii]|uniref:Gfo/Idh/MocA family oxidoreductase n=1 Tax=Candidatus Galacturonatibacter soehngenii TaxID=2307010 RepID=A0A7V7QKT2_9FIRM|nr:Gfo/Idh/MocA family oxidoreductase [Candidatus Galacturonibacter soehngenii]KAB1438457.1 Gfo/Idh/MocA family oxidoreductase [Candidatus Galacturonibacter soehngenii]
MSKIKVGIIGCGGIANQKHLPALSRQEDKVELVAFCDVDIERAKKAAEKYGVEGAKVYEDYNELLKDKTIDLVHVLTPNVSHSPITVAAFEAGKHVMCEKPMAHNTEAAQAMMDAWKKSGKKFTIGYQNRFRPEILTLHEACEAGELGEIYFAKAHAIRRRAVPTWGVFPDKSKQGGGPLIDIGTHALDITLWMMDNYEPVSVTGSVFEKLGHLEEATKGNMFGAWDPKTYEVEDSAFGYIKMSNGATIFLESSWAINMKESREACTTLCGTKAGAEVTGGMSQEGHELIFNKTSYGKLTEETLSPGGTIAFFEGKSDKEEDVECTQWLEAIINDTQPVVKPEQAFIVTKILDAIYKSAQSGKEIIF